MRLPDASAKFAGEVSGLHIVRSKPSSERGGIVYQLSVWFRRIYMASVTKREELPDLPFRRYRAMAKIVTAMQLEEAEDVPNAFAAGAIFHGEPGDWKIICGRDEDGNDDVAICAKNIFRERYEHVEGDRYRKKSTTVIDAAQLKESLDIVTLEGASVGEPGDWLLIGVEGDPYFNSDAHFGSNYVPFD
jgi:hypothetical protein